jgi:C4-dicarboxylate transporter
MGRPTLKNGNDIVNVDACKIADRYQLTLTLAKRQPGIIRGRVSLLGYCFLCLFWKTVVVRSKMSLQSGTAKKKQLTATAKPFYATAPLTHAIMIVNQLSISL